MSVIAFPGRHVEVIEVIEVREHGTGRQIWIFYYVGHDDNGPFRADVAHRYSPEEVEAEAALWRGDGVEVRGA